MNPPCWGSETAVSLNLTIPEQVFGWLKTVGGLRKLRHRGGALVDWIVTFAAAAYNLVRRTLVVTCP